jgi:copper(I)-binding protein
MKGLRAVAVWAACSGACLAHAGVTASEAWVRGTVPAQKSTGAFMTLTSTGPAKLVAVSTPAAKRAEIHLSSSASGVMQMKAVDAIDLPAGQRVELKPGGYHVMLLGLTAPLKEGDLVPLTLTVEGADRKRSSVEVKARVRPLAAR